MSRPSQPFRILLALALLVAVASLMLTLLSGADAALSIWDKLQRLPAWTRIAYLALLAALGAAAGWAVWRLLHPRAVRAPKAERMNRAMLEVRIERADADSGAARVASDELRRLDARRAEARVQVALFGEISAGKSSVLRALIPHTDTAIDARGGTTTRVSRHLGTLPDGAVLEIADVPGLHEVGDAVHASLARDEAARSHALLFVADGDLTRAQDAALRALAGYGRPLMLLLNKIDRYRDDERDALLQRLRERYAPIGVRVLPIAAGHVADVVREWPDGRRETVQRERAPVLGELPRVLQALARLGSDALEPGREAALIAHLDAQLTKAEVAQRVERSAAIVTKYTRRAVVGALAAVAPGTDLVIQGALASAMVRELCTLHGLGIRDLDLDGLLARAGTLARTSASITLAIVGNALKAFPGMGTLSGGLIHAVAYGLIFDSLGRAIAQTLAHTASLDREATLDAFRRELEAPAAERLKSLAALALDAWREHGQASPAASDEPRPRSGVQPPS